MGEVVLEKDCLLKPRPQLKPVVFVLCGDPRCTLTVDSEELKELGCLHCLDAENAANLIYNEGERASWEEDVIKRCAVPEDP